MFELNLYPQEKKMQFARTGVTLIIKGIIIIIIVIIFLKIYFLC